MKLKGNSYFLILIILMMLMAIVSSSQMEYFTSKLLPLVIGSAVLVMAAIGLGQGILTGDERQTRVSIEAKPAMGKAREGWRGFLLTFGWLVGFLLTIYLLGFLIAIPLFALTYMKLHGVRWLPTTIVTILVTAIVYSLFELLLNVILYRGVIFTWIG